MSTVAEIESAIEKLSIEEVSELAEWIQDYQATVYASSQVFSLLDSEEGPGEQWRDPK